MSNKVSAVEAVLEAVLQTALDGARSAKVENDYAALMAYYDILDVGLGMAREDGVALNSELSAVDPDALLKGGAD